MVSNTTEKNNEKTANTFTGVTLCGIELKNPVMAASGTFGYGYEFAELYDINVLGSFSFKGTTLKPRFGNPTPRIAECREGLINSIGLQNPGVERVIQEELPKLKQPLMRGKIDDVKNDEISIKSVPESEYKTLFDDKIMANIGGFSIEEYAEVSRRFDACEQIGWLEINVSCPNVHDGGIAFGTDPEAAASVVAAVKRVTTKPVIVKLSPNVTDITVIAKACENAGADGISLINTLLGMRIDLKTGKPVIANKMGGFSGPAVFPVAVRMVYQVYEAVSIPIIGIGGISTAEDVIEMMMAGATAVQIGVANLVDPYVCKKVIEELPSVMNKYKITDLKDIIGGAH